MNLTDGGATRVLPADVVRGIKQLDPLPITARRLLALIAGKDVAMGAIADVIEFDPSITAAVLRHASTLRYAASSPPSVRDAVLRLGTVALLDLVLEGYLEKLRVAAPMYDLTEHDLWEHGAAAQLAVRALVAERRRAGIPAVAETAALLHDIGKLIVTRYLKADLAAITTRARTNRITFVQAEREILGDDHAAVGGAMAEHWGFPPEITDAIRRHHSPPFDPPTPTLDAVVVANIVAKTIGAGLGAEGLNFEVDASCYRRLGLDFPAFGRVCLQTEEGLRQMRAAQGITR
jgi:putative nucleotidyltransferase with HDIG domain